MFSLRCAYDVSVEIVPSRPDVWPVFSSWRNGRDRIVVSTSRCGRENPGSNPGHGREL